MPTKPDEKTDQEKPDAVMAPASAPDAIPPDAARAAESTPPAAPRKADAPKPDETVPGGKIGRVVQDDAGKDVIKYYDAFGKPLDEKDHPPVAVK